MYYRRALMLQSYLERRSLGGWSYLVLVVMSNGKPEFTDVVFPFVFCEKWISVAQTLSRVKGLNYQEKHGLKLIWSLLMWFHAKFMGSKNSERLLRLRILVFYCEGLNYYFISFDAPLHWWHFYQSGWLFLYNVAKYPQPTWLCGVVIVVDSRLFSFVIMQGST